MNGIFTIDKDFIYNIFERTLAAIEDGKNFEKWKEEKNLLSNLLLIESIASWISPELVKDLIDACFVASLEKEEGRFYNFSISLQPPEFQSKSKFQFQNGIEFNSANIAKLAPAINSKYYCMGVWFNSGGILEIWGFFEKDNPHFTLSSISPGKIILDCLLGLEKTFKSFISVADADFISLKSFPNPVAEWLEKNSTIEEKLSYFNINSDLASIFLNMFSHGNGGAVLLVKESNNNWIDSIQQPILYSCSESYQDRRIVEKYSLHREYAVKEYGEINEATLKTIGETALKKLDAGLLGEPQEKSEFNYKISVAEKEAKNALFDIGNLTKIDGAVVLSKKFEILAFGAKIKPVNSNERPKEIIEVTPFEGRKPEPISLSKIGGTRHQSAAQFAYDQKDSISVVASQDGKLSVFWWQAEAKAVIRMKNYETMIG